MLNDSRSQTNGLTFYLSSLNANSLKDFFTGLDHIQIVGIVAGIFTSASMLPQVIKTFKEKKAEDLSLMMIFILMTGIGGWIYYGILRKDAPIIYTNCFSFLINLLLLILHFKYEEKVGSKKNK